MATTILSSFYLMIGFTALLSRRMKIKHYILLFTFLMLIYINNWVGTLIGQWGTFFLVLGDIAIIYASCRKLLEVLLSLCGYLILVFIQYCFTIPLSFMGITISDLQQDYAIPFLVVMSLIAILILLCLRRFFILPKLSVFQACPTKLLGVFLSELLLGICLMAFHFIFGEAKGYPSSILSWSAALLSTLLISTILVFYNMYNILKENQALSLQQAQAEIMQDYTRRMESFYEEIRSFRHDYQNILATLQDYIDTGDLDGLRVYYHNKIIPNAEILSDNGYQLGKLGLIEDTAVKSLLYTKIISILNYGLSFDLELKASVPPLPMDSLSLCRVLGILMDNAIEAALESERKILRLAILTEDSAVSFILANSAPPLQVPLSTLAKPGYSTKEGHSGLGLANVAKIIKPLSNVLLSTEYRDNIFRQILEIHL